MTKTLRPLWLILLLLGACTRQQPALQPLPEDALILAFGDSLTYGTGASRAQSYPARLQQLSGHKVVNAGIPGEISADGLKRLPRLLQKYHPDLVILIHGGNDILRKLPVHQTRNNLLHMIQQIRDSGSQVMLVAVPRPALLLSDAPLYAAVAEQSHTALLQDSLSDILQSNNNKSDAIHPNARGYAMLAQDIFDFLKKQDVWE